LSGVIQRNGIEDLARAVSQFFTLDSSQLEPGQFKCQIEFAASGQTLVYREDYACRIHARGELIGDRFGLGIITGGPGAIFSGATMTQSTVASAMTGEELDIVAPRGFGQIIMMVDQKSLYELADDAGLAPGVLGNLRLGRSGMPLAARPETVHAVQRKFNALLDEVASGSLHIHQEELEDLVYEAMLSVIDTDDVSSGRPSASVVVRRAIEVFQSSGGFLRMANIYRRLNVSPKTLQNAFRTITGLSPRSFFQRVMLNRARQALLASDSADDKVTAIVSKLGFTELGRFAVRYRELFGESPSATLRRQKRAPVAIPL
jgi:AraC-like DNA-binding protein